MFITLALYESSEMRVIPNTSFSFFVTHCTAMALDNLKELLQTAEHIDLLTVF